MIRPEDTSRSTTGWSIWGTGTVGVTKGQTIRLSTVNVGASGVTVQCGLWSNPSVHEDAYVLASGESHDCDVKGDAISAELFDGDGRAQIRALIKTSAPTVQATLEIFDNETGRTTIALPLQKFSA